MDAKTEAYRAALRRHDWTYEFSDDGSVWRAGKAQRMALLTQAAELDPDWAIWNEIAPQGFRVPSKEAVAAMDSTMVPLS